MINTFDKLQVLQQAHQFVLKIYSLTQSFPLSERHRLISQICRSSSSVPANIVEGNSRHSKKEFIQFLYQAKGSLAETQYHLMLAKDLKIIKDSEFLLLITQSDEIGKMISGLIKYLKNKI